MEQTYHTHFTELTNKAISSVHEKIFLLKIKEREKKKKFSVHKTEVTKFLCKINPKNLFIKAHKNGFTRNT